jgi:hypothetical protein
VRFRDLVLSDPSGGDALRLGFHPRLTVLAGLPGPARGELVEAMVTAAASGRPDRSLTTDGGSARAWVEALAPGRQGATQVEELARLDGRLVALDEHDARVAYHAAATRLEAVGAELAKVAELEPTAGEDAAVLAAGETVDVLEERVASATDRAERCRRVSAWAQGVLDGTASAGTPPAEASSEVVDLAARWDRTRKTVDRLDRDLAGHRTDEVTPGLDRRIALLAPLDQDALWDTHRRVADAEASFADALERRSRLEVDLPEDVEAAIDAAHLERVRAEEVVVARWRPGILGSSVPAVTGLVLALVEASIGGLLVVLGVGVAARLIVGPRVALRRASTAERRELARVGAESYLGLHLRRLADPTDPDAPQEMEAVMHDLEDAARERTAALVAWKELVGRLEPSEADGLETEIRVHAVRFNTALRTQTDARLGGELEVARRDLGVRADRLAASGSELAERAGTLDQDASAAQAELTELLAASGADPARRDEASRRQEQRTTLRARAEVEAEHAALVAEVTERERPGWAGTSVPPAPAAGTNLLRRRRAEVLRQIAAGLPTSLDAAVGDVPVVLDEPLAALAGEDLTSGLDRLLDEDRQVVYLTDDAAVAAWARSRSEADRLALIAFG